MIFFLLGCTTGEISPSDIKGIRIEPAELVITTSPGVPNTEEFYAYATLKNDDEILMDLIAWESSNLSAGSIDIDGVFTTVDTNGGVTNVTANHFGVEGTATVKVIYNDDIVENELSTSVIDAFASSSGDEDPDIGFLYPNDGVNLPRNLDGLGFLWIDPSASDDTVYRLRFQTEITDISVYTDSNRWISSSDLWVLISAANRDGTVTAYVQSGEWDGSSLQNIRQSPPISLIVNRLDARGSVLYWAGNTQAIMRIPFGQIETNLFWGTDTTNGGCVGCHSLADDSERLVVTHHGVNGRFSILDIEDPSEPVEIIGANDFNKATFKTLSPDGLYMLGFNGCKENQDGNTCGQIAQGQEPPLSRVTLYDIATGMPITFWDFDSKVSHPDWSPDGTQIVFVRSHGEYRSDMEFSGGEIVQRDIDVENLTFDNELTLKPQDATHNFYYPAYSPDGDWIAYNKAQNTAPELCKNAPDAEVWLMSRDGTIDLRLDNANGQGNVKNSYPKWGPLPDDDILWLAFSSQRQYPLRFDGSQGDGAPPPQKPQIWLAAIQPELAEQNQDPSSPPFWLPGQVPETDNHLPVWWSK